MTYKQNDRDWISAFLSLKIVTGKRNFGSLPWTESGTNVTLLVEVSATGSYLKFQDHFTQDGHTDCLRGGNSCSGITNNEFFIFV